MMNVPYVVLKYATLLLSFPINNVVEVVLTTLTAILKCTNNPAHLQGSREDPILSNSRIISNNRAIVYFNLSNFLFLCTPY